MLPKTGRFPDTALRSRTHANLTWEVSSMTMTMIKIIHLPLQSKRPKEGEKLQRCVLSLSGILYKTSSAHSILNEKRRVRFSPFIQCLKITQTLLIEKKLR